MAAERQIGGLIRPEMWWSVVRLIPSMPNLGLDTYSDGCNAQ